MHFAVLTCARKALYRHRVRSATSEQAADSHAIDVGHLTMLGAAVRAEVARHARREYCARMARDPMRQMAAQADR